MKMPTRPAILDGEEEVEVILSPVWCDLSLIRFADGEEHFVTMDRVEEEE